MEKKIAKKYADLIVQANNSTGRKEALSFIKQATKLYPVDFKRLHHFVLIKFGF